MNQRYSSLDGLRAYAAIGLVLMHVWANIDVQSELDTFLYARVIHSLRNFIYLFFAISAFSMCCGYYERMKTGQLSMNKFYLRRYQRILPFFTILILIDCIVPHGPNNYELTTISDGTIDNTTTPTWLAQLYESFANLTLAFNLLPNPDIKVIGVGWFLGVVFLFYMLFPFFVFMMDSKRRAWKSLLLTLIFCYIALDYFYTDKFVNFHDTRHNIIFIAPFFCLGGLVYLYRDSLSLMVKKYRWLSLFVCWIAVIIYYVVIPSNYLYVLAMFLIWGLWIIYAIGTEGKILNNKFTKYISDISMEIYLCHMMCFRAVEKIHLEKHITNPDILYWVSCILTIIGAVIFSHVFKYIIFPKIEPYIFKNTK